MQFGGQESINEKKLIKKQDHCHSTYKTISGKLLIGIIPILASNGPAGIFLRI